MLDREDPFVVALIKTVRNTDIGTLEKQAQLNKTIQAIKDVNKDHKDVKEKELTRLKIIDPEATAELLPDRTILPTLDHGLEDGKTALIWATILSSYDTMDSLIAANANPNSDDLEEHTPLAWAVAQNDSIAVKKLLAANADPNKRNQHGATPLVIASDIHSFEMVKTLLDHKAEINIQTFEEETALIRAIRDKYLIYQTKLKHLKKYHPTDENKLNTIKQRIDISNALIDCLLEKKANTNVINSSGKTAFMIAIEYSDLEMMKKLLTAKADINLITKGTSPLDYAVQSKQLDAVCFLLMQGATIPYDMALRKFIITQNNNLHLDPTTKLKINYCLDEYNKYFIKKMLPPGSIAKKRTPALLFNTKHNINQTSESKNEIISRNRK